MTERQRILLFVAIDILRNVSGIVGVEAHTVGLDYDDVECDLSCLADDIKIEFNL